jgi:L-phenylalanine/L-methionine N-acetyltransferase
MEDISMESRVPTSSDDIELADSSDAIEPRTGIKPGGALPGGVRSLIAGLVLRAQEPSDFAGIAALMDLPKVRWGTLRLPYTSREFWRKRTESPPDDRTAIVAVLDGGIVGNAGIWQDRGRRRHSGTIGMSVHDDFHGRGIGSALMAALIEVADNWLDLKRLELTVYVDNAPAIGLYRKFGFEVEGTRRYDTFRDGKYVDSFEMARLRPGWSP